MHLGRELAAADPDAYQPFLSDTLVVLAEALTQVGQYGQAAAAAGQAVELYQRLLPTMAAKPTDTSWRWRQR